MRLAILATALFPLLAWGAPKDSCFECHSVMEGMSVVFKDDVHYHNRLSCADCHGGDPSQDDQNVSMNASRGFKVRVTRQGTPDYCGHCHSQQLASYRTSVHSAALARDGAPGAQCVDCHSVHNIRAVSDPLSPAHPDHIAETCGKCHAHLLMVFGKSAHRRMAGCASCHASHATRKAGNGTLTGSKGACTQCHEVGSTPAQAAAEMERLLADLEAAATTSKAAAQNLARARLAVHSFDVAAVRQAAGFNTK